MADVDRCERFVRHVEHGLVCCDPEWEAAYRRFETPQEEIAKFTKRLLRFGFDTLARDLRIVEFFCGRGGGLMALERLGFRSVAGVDLSESLLSEYRGSATLHLADCRRLPFSADSYDIAVVHGGLHHLPELPKDLDQTIGEVSRVLTPGGRFFVVEPWRTPFLTFAHTVTNRPLIRRLYAKGDALATMTEREWETYEQWLNQPKEILRIFDRHLTRQRCQTRWGKLNYVGQSR